jgi:hypothetical protein
MSDEGCGRGEGRPGRYLKMPRRLCSSTPLLLCSSTTKLFVSQLSQLPLQTIRLLLISLTLAGTLSIKDTTIVSISQLKPGCSSSAPQAISRDILWLARHGGRNVWYAAS